MNGSLKLLLLPIRAPMITLLGLISFYLGANWGFEQDVLRGSGIDATIVDKAYWIFYLAQVFVVILFCTLPDLVFGQLTLFMGASKFLALALALLFFVLVNMYLWYKPGNDLTILASALLLARLDLARLRIWPSSWLALFGFTVFVMFFITYGEMVHLELYKWPMIRNLLELKL